MSRRARQKAAVRDRLVDAALELFARDGLDATPIEAITRRAGVAKGTFFNYFDSKPAILAERYWELVNQAYGRSEALPARPARRWIDRHFTNLARTIESARAMTRVVLGEAAHPVIRRLELQSWERGQAMITRVLEEGKAADEVRRDIDSATAVRVISSVWTGTLHEWLAAEPGFPLVPEVRRRVLLLWDGIASPTGWPVPPRARRPASGVRRRG